MKKKLLKVYNATKQGLTKHLVDSTALVIATTPVFTVLETNLAGITEDTSIHARLMGMGLTYAGMGGLFTGGMYLSRKKFNIKKEDTEMKKNMHDALYSLFSNGLTGPLFYYVAGVRDLKEIAIGTVCGMGLALFLGGPTGYLIDSYRDFTGIEKSERLPNIIKNQTKKTKLGLAGLLAATSLGLTAGIYEINSYLNYAKKPQEIINAPDKPCAQKINSLQLILK